MLRHDPPTGSLVVLRNDVTVIVLLAGTTESGPDRAAECRTIKHRSRRLVKDGKTKIDPLHILGCSDGSTAVWSSARPEGREAFQIQPRGHIKGGTGK